MDLLESILKKMTKPPTVGEQQKKPMQNGAFNKQIPPLPLVLTARTVFVTFFIVGPIFILIGICLLHVSNNVKEFVYDYTDCIGQKYPTFTCATLLKLGTYDACTCAIPIE